jgi:monovalent cation:H+ antiporter-2, CPA2 family
LRWVFSRSASACRPSSDTCSRGSPSALERRREILKAAGVPEADYLLVTVPDVLTRTAVIVIARELNPDVHVFARARYLKERVWLEEMGATEISIEEAGTAIGLAILLLREIGADSHRIQKEIQNIRQELGIRRGKGQIAPSP